jgi:hypothetical protein
MRAELKSVLDELVSLVRTPGPSPETFSLSDLKDFTALVALTAKVGAGDLDGHLAVLLAEFAAKIGFEGVGPGKPELQSLIDSYLIRHPPHPVLMQRYGSRVAEALGRTVSPAFWRSHPVRG